MKMKYELIIFLLLCFLIHAKAQESENVVYPHQLGLHAGSSTGIGLSYRYWPGKLGIQATFIPLKTDDSWKDLMGIQQFYRNIVPQIQFARNTTFISIGLTGLLTLKPYDHFNLFSYLGNHLLFLDENTYYNTGIGLGFAIDKPVSFNFMVGYGLYDILNGINLFPTLELGVYYRFQKF